MALHTAASDRITKWTTIDRYCGGRDTATARSHKCRGWLKIRVPLLLWNWKKNLLSVFGSVWFGAPMAWAGEGEKRRSNVWFPPFPPWGVSSTPKPGHHVLDRRKRRGEGGKDSDLLPVSVKNDRPTILTLHTHNTRHHQNGESRNFTQKRTWCLSRTKNSVFAYTHTSEEKEEVKEEDRHVPRATTHILSRSPLIRWEENPSVCV